MACATRSPSCTHSKVAAWVAARTTGGAMPASNASCQRGAHRHHWSPGCRPAKPNSGCGVERSLPTDAEKCQELGGHPGADRVDPDVLGPGVAAPVAVEAGDGVVVAGLERFPEDVLGHGPFEHGPGAAPQTGWCGWGWVVGRWVRAPRAGCPRSGRSRRRSAPARGAGGAGPSTAGRARRGRPPPQWAECRTARARRLPRARASWS